MIILGLSCFHGDSSAAIVRDGTLVAAAEEERFRRIKHWAGFPAQAIAYCLAEAGISLADVDHVAVNQDSRANLVGKLRYVLSQRPDPALLWSRWRIRRARLSTISLLQSFSGDSFKAPVHAL
jgi:carbamoyltransferase